MKRLLPLIVALCCPALVFCQDVTGLWKGTMYNDSTSQSFDYEVVITKAKGKITGYSHTSYTIADKKYYCIKKVQVRVAHDGKIVLQDAKMLENNNGSQQSKNVIQLNVLSLANAGEESYMDGIFVTNRSKAYEAVSGRMSIKKVNPALVKSDLIDYLRHTDDGDAFTAGK